MTAWAFDGIELPSGNAARQWWISEWLGARPAGPVALDKAAAQDTLRAWVRSG